MHYYIISRTNDKLSTRYTSIINALPKDTYYTRYSYNFIWIADINIKSSEIVKCTNFGLGHLEDHRTDLRSDITSFLSGDGSRYIIYRKPKINKWEF